MSLTGRNKHGTVRTQGEQMFVLSGTVSHLYVTDGTVNLLQGMQIKLAASGVVASLGGLSGTAATSAMLAMYEGEEVDHFGCYLGERLVIGTFPDIDFKDGDEIKVVATRLDERADYAHAVVRPKDALLWMPYSVSKGRWMIGRWILIACLCYLALSLVFFALFHLFDPWKEGFVDLVATLGPAFVGFAIIMGGGIFWTSRHDAFYAEEILKVLGFKNPGMVNLSPYSLARQKKGVSYMVYDLRKALRAYSSLRKAQTPS